MRPLANEETEGISALLGLNQAVVFPDVKPLVRYLHSFTPKLDTFHSGSVPARPFWLTVRS